MTEKIIHEGLEIDKRLKELYKNPNDTSSIQSIYNDLIAFISKATKTGNSHLAVQMMNHLNEKSYVSLFNEQQLENLEKTLYGTSTLSRKTSLFRVHFEKLAQEKNSDFKSLIKPKYQTDDDKMEDVEFDPEFGELVFTPTVEPESPIFEVLVAQNKINNDIFYIPEIVSYIFTFLSVKEQLMMKRVCKLWNEIGNDELLWKYKFIDSWTTFDGESNWTLPHYSIKYDKTNHKKERQWQELCLTCDRLEDEFRKSKKTALNLTSFSNDEFNYNRVRIRKNRLFCSKFSKDGSIYACAGQSEVIKTFKTEDILNLNRALMSTVREEDRMEMGEEERFIRAILGLIRSQRPPPRVETEESIPGIVEMKSIPCHDVSWSILDVDISPDNRWLAYGTWQSYVTLCPLVDGARRRRIALENNEFHHSAFSVRFSPDGKELLAGSCNGNLYIVDLVANKVVWTCEASYQDVNSTCYGGDANPNIIFSGGDDCLCKLWDKRIMSSNVKNTPVGVLIGHKFGITSCVSKGDGIHYLSSSKDQSMKLWDIRKLASNDVSYDERRIIRQVLRSLNEVQWDYREPSRLPSEEYLKKKNPLDKSLMTYSGHHKIFKTLIRCDFSPLYTTGQKYVYTGSSDGTIAIYDVLTGKLVQSIHASSDLIRECSWNPYVPLMCCASWDTSAGIVTYKSKGNDLEFLNFPEEEE